MAESLKNRIVRNPAGRIFLVEKVPESPKDPMTLRRLDREPREQARIFRPGSEVQGWVVFDPQPALQPLQGTIKDAIRDFLRALEAWPKPDPDAEYLVPGSNLHLNRLAQLVED